MEQVKRATFADLIAQSYEFEIISPGGETLLFELRALTYDERARIDFERNPRPRAPVKEIKKVDDQFYEIYDYQEPGYRQKMADWLNRQIRLHILTALTGLDIPGETDDERLESLNQFGGWALDGLWKAVSLLTVTGDDAVRRRTFQPGGNGDLEAMRPETVDTDPVL